MRTVDDAAARSLPGVVAVTRIPTGVAVVAESFDQALAARDALVVDWRPGPAAPTCPTPTCPSRLAAANPSFALPPLGSLTVDRTFEFAFVPHAPLEVLNCVADVRADRAELWLPSKSPIVAAQSVALALGLPADRVTLHVVRGGGSFGRRLFFDPAIEAALVSRAVGRPVRLLWTRADDMHHGRLRPASHHRARATHLLGQVLSYEHRMASVALDGSHGLGELLTAVGAQALGAVGPAMFQLSQLDLYHLGAQTRSLREVDLPFPTGSWRSVFSGQVRTVDEVMVDELARVLRRDPVAFRRARLRSARLRAVLDQVAAAGPWGRAMAPGTAQGLGLHEEYKSVVAFLVELDARDPAAPAGDAGRGRRGRRPGGQPPGPGGPDAGRPGGRPVGDPAGGGAHRRRGRAGEQLHRLPLRPHAGRPGRGRGPRDAPDRRARRRRRAGRARRQRRGRQRLDAPPARCPAASRSCPERSRPCRPTASTSTARP